LNRPQTLADRAHFTPNTIEVQTWGQKQPININFGKFISEFHLIGPELFFD